MCATGTTSKRSQSTNLVVLGAIGISLPIFYAIRSLPHSLFAIWWTWILQHDLGNALAALVAVAGYMVEHKNSRRLRQLEAQIDRVLSQSHELLVPITTQMQALCLGSIRHFVDAHFDDAKHLIVSEYGDAQLSEKLLSQFSELAWFNVPTEVRHPASFLFWRVDVMCHNGKIEKSALGLTPAISSPTELPAFLHRAIQECDKPNSRLWKSYEAFVRCELLPAVDRIAEIIDRSGHLMEPVSPARLTELFGKDGTGCGLKWSRAPRMFFYSMWLAYARSWHTLIRKWDDGILDDIRPFAWFPCGLLFFNIEAQTLVAQIEKDLVGFSQMHGSVNTS